LVGTATFAQKAFVEMTCSNNTNDIQDIETKSKYLAGTATFAQKEFVKMPNVPTTQMTLKILT
jgi:hypothetical protein